jgi:hypothetical protein
MVLDLLRSLFGEATLNEIALVALFFFCVVIYATLPRVGEAIGARFERHDR